MANNRIQYTLDFKANLTDVEGQLSRLKQSLISVINAPIGSNATGKLKSDLDQASIAATKLKGHLQQGLNPKTGLLDLSRFSISLKAAGDDIGTLSKQMLAAGDAGKTAFLNTTNAMVNAQGSIVKTNKLMSELWVTLKNTAKWQISSYALNSLLSVGSKALSYFKNLDKTLTDIRIVSGDSADQMQRFAKEANRAASALRTTTNEFAKANLIYRQQGDSAAEAMRKAEITTKAANVSFGTSAEEMSNYLTAVWNSYQVTGKELELYVDKLAKVGAITATSTEEMATAMQKVAASAHETGVEYDQLLSVISTVSSVTRESAESTGTAFKTIFARMTDLKLEGSVDDGGLTTTLGDVSGSLEAIGVKVMDAKGELRDTGDIITDLGNKWKDLDKNTQSAIAQVVAGKRQYTQLMALFGNWDMYKNTLKEAAGAQGELNKQNSVYLDSMEAASKKLSNNFDHLIEGSLDGDIFKDLVNGLADVTWVIGEVIESIGGIGPVLTYISGIMLQKFAPQITQGLVNMGMNVVSAFGRSDVVVKKYLNGWSAAMLQASKSGTFQGAELKELNTMSLLVQYKEQMEEQNRNLTAQEKERNQLQYDYLKTQIEINNAKAKEEVANAKYRKASAENRFEEAMGGSEKYEIFKNNGLKDTTEYKDMTFKSKQLNMINNNAGGVSFESVTNAWDNLNNASRNEAIQTFSSTLNIAEPIIRNYIESIKALISAESNLNKVLDESQESVETQMKEEGMAGVTVEETKSGYKEKRFTPKTSNNNRQQEQIEKAKNIVANTDMYTEEEVADAKELLRIMDQMAQKQKEINNLRKNSATIDKDQLKSLERKNLSKNLKDIRQSDNGLAKIFEIFDATGLSPGQLLKGKNKVTSKDVFTKMSKMSNLEETFDTISEGKASKELTNFLQIAAQTEAEGEELVKVIRNIMNAFNGVTTDKAEGELRDLERQADNTGRKLNETGKTPVSFNTISQQCMNLGGTLMQVSSSVSMVISSFKQLSDPDLTSTEKITAGFSALGTILMSVGTVLPSLISSVKAAKTAQDGFNASAAMNPYILIGMVIVGIIMAIVSALGSQKDAQEEANEATEKAKQSAQKYEEYKNKVKETTKELEKLRKLEAAGTISAADKQRLEMLDKEIEYYKAKEKEAKKEAIKDSKEAYKAANTAKESHYAGKNAYTFRTVEGQGLQVTKMETDNLQNVAASRLVGFHDYKEEAKNQGKTSYEMMLEDKLAWEKEVKEKNISDESKYKVSAFDNNSAAQRYLAARNNVNYAKDDIGELETMLYHLSNIEANGGRLTSAQKKEKSQYEQIIQQNAKGLVDFGEKDYFTYMSQEDKVDLLYKHSKGKASKDTLKGLDSETLDMLFEKGLPSGKDAKKKGTEFMEAWINGAREKAKQDGDLIFKDINSTINDLKTVNKAFEDISENGRISYETLAEMEEVMGSENFSKYADILSSADTSSEKYKKALTDVTRTMVKQNLTSANLIDMGKDRIAQMYKEAGVTNSAEIAAYDLAEAYTREYLNGNMTIESLLSQGEMAGYTKEQIVALMFSVYNLNSANLDGSQKIAELKRIYMAAGMTKAAIEAVMGYTTITGQDAIDYIGSHKKDYKGNKNEGKVAAMAKGPAKDAKIFVDKDTNTIYTTETGVQNANVRQAEKDIEEQWGQYVPSTPAVNFSGGGGTGGSGGSGGKDDAADKAEQLKELRKEEQELLEEHVKNMKEWEKQDAIERYADQLTRLQNVLDDLQITLDKTDFESNLFGEDASSSQMFNMTREKGEAAHSVAEEALRQFNELKNNMPEHAESIAEWRDKLQSLRDTWQENVMTMRENSVSAALIAGMEKNKERLEQEKEYISEQQSLFKSIQELSTKSGYFAQASRKALLSSAIARANSFGAKTSSEAARQKQEENEELLKINDEFNEKISEANKEAMEADIKERAIERAEEWEEIQKEFVENMENLKKELGELGASLSDLSNQFINYANSSIAKTQTMNTEMGNYKTTIQEAIKLWDEFEPKYSDPLGVNKGNNTGGHWTPTGWVTDTKAKGGKAKGGITLVGEEGPELVIEPGGKAYLVGVNGPEFVNLKAGSEVMPNKDTNAVLKRSKDKPTESSKKVESFAAGTTGDNSVSIGGNTKGSTAPKSNKNFYDKEAKEYANSLKDMSEEREKYNKDLIDETQEAYDTLYQQKVTQDQMVKDSNNQTLDEMKAYQDTFNTDIYNGIATNAESIKDTSVTKAGEIQTAVMTSNIVMKNDTATSAAIMEGTVNKMSFTLPGINGRTFVESVTSVLNSARAATGLTPVQQAEVRGAVQGGGGGDEAYSGKINATGNPKRVYELLKQKGVPDMSAKAIVANLQGESGGSINPASVGDGGTSFGIAQWHNTRGTNMKNYVGTDWRTDLAGQVDFMLYEMKKSYPGVYNALMNPGNSTPKDLIRKLVYQYEIPRDPAGQTSARYKNYLQLVKGFGSSGDGDVSYGSLMQYIDTFNSDPLSMFEIMMYANLVKQAMNNGNTERLFELMGPMFEWTDPLDPGFHVGSGVGWRIHPIHGDRRFHYGVDIGAPQGTPIYAVRPGVVETAGYGGGAGNYVKIRHDSGYATRYLHMVDTPSVSSGQMVRKGQVIGYVGSTGWSTGPHLHFEMYQNGQVIDPLPKLPNYAEGTGDGKTKVTENAVVGELGPELAIFPDGSIKMLGQDGVEYAHIPAGTKIFTNDQTKEFLKTPKNYATGTLEGKEGKYLTELNEAAKKFGIPPELLLAMADAESNLGTHANTWKSSGDKKAVGITQLSEKILDSYKDKLKTNEEIKKILEESKVSVDKAREENEEHYKDNIWVTAAILKLIKDEKYKEDKDWKNVIGYFNSAGQDKWSDNADIKKFVDALIKASETDTFKAENVQKAIDEAAKKLEENTKKTEENTKELQEIKIKKPGIKEVTYQTTTTESDKGIPREFNRMDAFKGIGGLYLDESENHVLASSDNYARILEYFNASPEVQKQLYEYTRTRAFYSVMSKVPNGDEKYKAYALNAVKDFAQLDLDEGTKQILKSLEEYLTAETFNKEEFLKTLEPFLGAISYRDKNLKGYGIDAGMFYSSLLFDEERSWDEEGFKNEDIGVRSADQRILANIEGSVNDQVSTIMKEKDISIRYINDLLVANGLMDANKHPGDVWNEDTKTGAAKLLEDPSYIEKGIVTHPFLEDLRQMYTSIDNGLIVGSLSEVINMDEDKMLEVLGDADLVNRIINSRIAISGGRYQLRDSALGQEAAKKYNEQFYKTMDITYGEDGKTVVDWDFKKVELDKAQYIRDMSEIQAKDAKNEYENDHEFREEFTRVNINAAKEFGNQADAMYEEQQKQDKLWAMRYKFGEISEEEYAAYQEYASKVYETIADIIEQEEEMYRTAYESNKELYEQYVEELTQRYELAANKAETLASAYEQHYSTLNNLADIQHEIDNTLRESTMNTQWLDKKTRELLFDETDHFKVTSKISEIKAEMLALTEDYQTKINSLTEDEWYKQEKITAEYQRQVQEKERSLAILRAEVGLEAKRNALTQALQERNVRVFTGGRWQNVANFNDVRSKSQEYENQLYEIEKAEREQTQAAETDKFRQSADESREAIAAMNQAMANLDEEFNALFGALGNLSEKSIPELIEGLEGQESMILSVMSQVGEKMGLEEDPGIEAAKRKQEMNDLYEQNKGSIFNLYEEALDNMLNMELAEKDSEEYNSAKDGLDALKAEIKKLGGEEFYYMLDNFSFGENIRKIKSHSGSGDEYDAILQNTWASAASKAEGQLISAQYDYVEADKAGDEKAKLDATRKGRRSREVLGDLPYYEFWETWQGSIEETEQKMAEHSIDAFIYMLADAFMEKGARDDEELKGSIMQYSKAKSLWAETDRKEKSGEISKEQAGKDKNVTAVVGERIRDSIANFHGYGEEIAELLKVLTEDQFNQLIELIYGTALPQFRDETGLMDIPQGHLFEMSTLKDSIINGNEDIKQYLTSLVGGILPNDTLNSLGENSSTTIENLVIELPNVVDATTFAEEFNILVQEGFTNKPQN